MSDQLLLIAVSLQPLIHTKLGPPLFSITFPEMFQFVEPSSEYLFLANISEHADAERRRLTFLADAALKQVVAVAGPAHRMLTLLPMLVIPLQKLLRDDDPKIVSRVVELLQILVTCDAVEQGGMGLCGRALVASYNKLCPTLNALRESMPQFEPKVMETLELMEVHGGAVRATAAEGRSSMEQMQGMFVRCLSEIKREIAAISAADSIEPAVE